MQHLESGYLQHRFEPPEWGGGLQRLEGEVSRPQLWARILHYMSGGMGPLYCRPEHADGRPIAWEELLDRGSLVYGGVGTTRLELLTPPLAAAQRRKFRREFWWIWEADDEPQLRLWANSFCRRWRFWAPEMVDKFRAELHRVLAYLRWPPSGDTASVPPTWPRASSATSAAIWAASPAVPMRLTASKSWAVICWLARPHMLNTFLEVFNPRSTLPHPFNRKAGQNHLFSGR